jgi:hypothetical protein
MKNFFGGVCAGKPASWQGRVKMNKIEGKYIYTRLLLLFIDKVSPILGVKKQTLPPCRPCPQKHRHIIFLKK